LELGDLTTPALLLLDSQCATANVYVNKAAPAYDNNAVQAAMAQQDNRYLFLYDVDFGEVSIMLVNCVN
jgi:hypothetical protein